MIRFEDAPAFWMPRVLLRTFCALALVLIPVSARAQMAVAGWDLSSERQERIGENHLRLSGSVEIKQGNTSLFADVVELFSNEDRAVATGNVVFVQGANRISADRADFNTRTRLGTFYNATGIASIQPPRQRPQPGAFVAPQLLGQDTNVFFFGESVEKLGPKKYRIRNGGFTTCVQPTPRWNLQADTVVLNVDHYTTLRQAVFTVKGVPMLYLPFMYYPTNKENRATGFLIPTYGISTLQGQSIHNAFFWAINRSQDATILHDWFSKTGQGVGSEYRYNFGGGSDGSVRAYMLNQHEASYPQSNGTTTTVPASRSYEVRGGLNQALPWKLRARANVNYFSSLTEMQTFNTNIYDASRNQSTYGGNVVGAWGTYTLNTTVNRTEYFAGATSSTVTGSAPSVQFTRNERPLFGTPLYFSVTTAYDDLLRDAKVAGKPDINKGQSRFDIYPQIRFPFKQWQWFTVNSSLTWRDTYYTRSYVINPATGKPVVDPATNQAEIADSSVNRRFFTAQAQMVGPVFTRIWDTPTNGYAEKFKHTVEPFLNIQRTSSIDNSNEIVQLDGTDYIVGGTTQYTYGLNNRFYAKRRLAPGQPAQSRESVTVSLTQSYYTNDKASQVDQQYQSSQYGSTSTVAAPSKFSPVQLAVRSQLTNDFNATFNAEIDSRYHKLRTISANGTYAWSGRLQTGFGWSKTGIIPQVGLTRPSQSITGSANAHTRDNRVGSIYSFNYDVQHSALLQQQISTFYNSQCCGIAFQFQSYNFAGLGSSVPVPADHRFFLSFTLAGLGSFSPFNGAMSGVPH